MIKISRIAVLAAALLVVSHAATAAVTMSLNTGYDYNVWGSYTPVPVIGSPSPATTRDNYWINIGSYPTTTLPIDQAYVLWHGGPWASLPGARWISARNMAVTTPPVPPGDAYYTIFKKCFCLQPNFAAEPSQLPKIDFIVKGDQKINIWLNTMTTVVVAPNAGTNTPAGFPVSNWPATQSPTNTPFRAGINCLYVLLEDLPGGSGRMGFFLKGTVTANGLLETAAAGLPPTLPTSFGECDCHADAAHPSPSGSRMTSPGREGAGTAGDDDEAVVKQILEYAEKNRAAGALEVQPERNDPSGTELKRPRPR